MTGLNYILLMVFPALLVAAAVSDLLTMTIPNRIPLLILAAFAPAAWAAGFDLQTIGWHLLVGVLALAVCFGMFALNWIGGGDAKLAAVIALWIGPNFTLFEWTLLFALCGGVLTLALLGVRQFALPAFLVRHKWIARLHEPRGDIPYGIALSAAALAVYPTTVLFERLAV